MRTLQSNAREEMTFYGVDSLSLQQLLAIVLGTNNAAVTGRLAALGMETLLDMTEQDLMNVEGVTKTMAFKIRAIIAFGNKMKRVYSEDQLVIRSPEDAAKCFEDLSTLPQEHFKCLFLSTKNKIIAERTIFVGTLNSCNVTPREIFREAVRLNAAAIIVGHNHPSGDPMASKEDWDMTKRLMDAGEIMGVKLLDHIIIGHNKFNALLSDEYII